LHSVDPQTYFSDVLTKLLPAPRQPPPMRWSSQDNVELMTQKEVLNFKPAPPDCQPCTLSGNSSKQAVCKMGHSMLWGLLAHFAAGGNHARTAVQADQAEKDACGLGTGISL